jgi:NTP pyrophosphatase (non-canonical NTP hydrolase)
LDNLNTNMTQVIDTNKYIEFVRQTTSPASSDFAALLIRLTELEASADADVPRLMTAAFGISAEAGEFTEVIKKIFLQGKPYNEDNVFHLKRELGDICWYIAQACMALDTTFDEVLQMNYEKLSARYPEGTFDVFRSENRVEGDL